MPADPEQAGWLQSVVAGLGLTTTGLGAWILKTSSRQARIEEKVSSLEKSVRRTEKGVSRILNHLTGTDLHADEGD